MKYNQSKLTSRARELIYNPSVAYLSHSSIVNEKMPMIALKRMKISYLVAFIIATAVVASPLAYSAPISGQGTQVTPFQSHFAHAYGYFYDGNTDTYFEAQAYDDKSGVPQGSVIVVIYLPSFQYITCSGPAYGNVVSVDRGGNSFINATLNPTSLGCYSYNVDVSKQYGVNLTGKYNGDYRDSQTGTGKRTYYGENYTYNSQYDYFGETFTGTNGFYSGTFTGSVDTQHYTNLTQLK